MSFGNIKKKKRLLVLLLCTILAGVFYDGMWQQSG